VLCVTVALSMISCCSTIVFFCCAIAALPGAQGQCTEARPQICEFNFNSQECFVRRSYAAALLRRYEGGALAGIADHVMSCQDAGESGDCSVGGCELDGHGLCVAERVWTVSRMIAGRSSGGLGLGHERCGLFGGLLEQSGLCFNRANRTHCEEPQPGELAWHCFWNATQGWCEVSQEALMTRLVQDYREEFARVALQRDGCATRSSESVCAAAPECRWESFQQRDASEAPLGRLLQPLASDKEPLAAQVPGLCLLRVVDSLVAISGNDCPLKTMFKRHADCAETAENEWACRARQRLDGLPMCVWVDERCEVHPTSMEFDLLSLLGAQSPELSAYVRRAQASCTNLTLGLCEDKCEVRISGISSRATPLFMMVAAATLLGFARGTAELL